MSIQSATTLIDQNGYAIIRDVFSEQEIAETTRRLTEVLCESELESESIRSQRGSVFAARNVLELFPDAKKIWRVPVLVELLRGLIGSDFGLVRALFFDKPPDRTWALPWHKDLTIAVKDNSIPTSHFSKPTRKANVPHVEGSEAILGKMLTLRIHLDPMTRDNGPLRVISGSHLSGKRNTEIDVETDVTTILLNAGDVFAMRPMISHSSIASSDQNELHRRILHLEFSGTPELPDGYQWHTFER